MRSEEWRDIPGFNNYYQASSLGRVRSKQRQVNGYSARAKRPVMMSRKSNILSQNIRGRGYRYVCIAVDGSCRKEQVHKLVLMAFNGDRPEGMFACHNNGDPSDNRIENLRWATPKDNQYDRICHGTDLRGEQVLTSKLNEGQVRMIKAGLREKDAKQMFGISRTQFYRIKRGEAWVHI